MLATQKRQISSKKLHIHTVSFQILRNEGNMILLVLRCGSLIEYRLLLSTIFFICAHILFSLLMGLHFVTFSHNNEVRKKPARYYILLLWFIMKISEWNF
jgi:hypothetical protein